MGTFRTAALTCSLFGCTLTDLGYLQGTGGSATTSGGTSSSQSATTSSAASTAAASASASTSSESTTVTASSSTGGLPTYGEIVLSDAPIAYYPLDESSGTTAFDASPNVHHGVYFGNTTLGAEAPAAGLGTSIELAGSPGGVRVLGDFTEFEGTAPFSVEAWFEPHSYPHDYLFLFAKSARDVNNVRQHYGLYMHDINGLAFERWVDDVGADAAGPLPSLATWHHVVATYDGSFLTLYIDGAAVSTFADPRSQPAKGVPFFIGSQEEMYGTPFAKIDEVAIYDKALEGERVAAHYSAVFP